MVGEAKENKNTDTPDVSFVVPCYNEEGMLGYTLPRLEAAFEKAGFVLELVAVDNGSVDKTGELIKELAKDHPSIVHHRVDVNEGYGNGVLQGIPRCTAPWIGIIPADGQVDAEDVVRLYETVITTDGNVVGKVRRRFRMDGLYRKVVSTSYNLFVRMLFPRLESIDINGSPKLLPAKILRAMDLRSKGWLLDPEIMIKAHYMGLRVLELNVFARMRGNGVSHVRAETCWEFLYYLIRFRFSKEWKKRFISAREQAAVTPPGPAGKMVEFTIDKTAH
ncbi:MAG: glycosyltransferase family 2 protein [Acidobacteria bacterium]|nr:MAG: glycosyltransferase family 2 protein [Acidobacteriota bacterium]REK01171.1 MAG: glycosyltransferase family 2 protein [Acidobacteriota bacterium]REK14127.1 MAG: glycosyltransferase family 2 protein [Acidobacteriota bacterium]REK44842.1 MAG: glycosyltransferase family 2 protein [Acidobacteriota bacterium]